MACKGRFSIIKAQLCWRLHLNAVEGLVVDVLHGILLQEGSEHGLDGLHVI